eukprot:CAMPEP_0198725506 /NCGR_PEP_ID=MMETSP1475-20131203/2804_1 /TAXON_ID= ORGANISM="Unidentified sp., Strain CCMP1999" /NCGR_SAMPLE_ID=MMETSP1475 /ASSEMBLY_ACC=CAM_ASM_001111 /LENGTH=1074 /DNA_ID=CAMNT_0044487299 /DNA_START=165 /DNA_END=3386 /DNA_ORIENTATION=-
MVLQYKKERITKERIGVFTGWKDFNVSGCVPPGRKPYTLLGQVWTEPQRSAVTISASGGTGRIRFDEAVQLIDRRAQVGDTFGPSWETYWFRLEVSGSTDLAGKEVHLIWDSESEAMLWSEDGRPLQGLVGGDSWCRRVDYRLETNAPGTPWSKVFYVEMACNGLFGVGRGGDIEPPDPHRTFVLRECGLSVFDREAWDTLCDVTFVDGCANELPDENPRSSMALVTANNAVNKIEVEHPETWRAGREAVAEFCRDRNGSAQAAIYAIGHCHIDTAWLWPYDETKRKCARSWATQLRNMEMYPEYKFVCSQAQQLHWMKTEYPVLYEEIKEYVRLGRFVITGGTWVEMDCNLPSGESLVRQFLEGQRYFYSEFGVKCRTFWLPDTFGYSSQLPQIMKSAGIDYFLTQKLSWNLFNKFPHSVFRWEGLDGSQVVAHFPPADSYCCFGKVDEVVRSVTNNKDIGVTNASILLVGHGDGGGGASPAMIESLKRMEDVDGIPKVNICKPDDFFDFVNQRRDELPKWVGELYFELHRGTYTSQAKIKSGNRDCELALRNAELLSVLAEILPTDNDSSFTYPKAALKSCWHRVLLHQFHDTLPGSCIRQVIEVAHKDHENVQKESLNMQKRAIDVLIARLCNHDLSQNSHDRREEQIVSLLNVQGCPSLSSDLLVHLRDRTMAPKDSLVQDDLIDSTQPGYLAAIDCADVPKGIGVSTSPRFLTDARDEVRVREVERSSTQTPSKVVLENKFVRLVLDRFGLMQQLSLIDSKCSGAEQDIIHSQSTGRGNQFVLYDDVPLFWDAWDIEVYHFEKFKRLSGATDIEVLERGPLRATVKISFDCGTSGTIEQTISLTAFSARVIFKVVVDWRADRKLLGVEFPTTIRSQHASYDTQFGFVQRPTHFNTSWDVAKFEVCGHRYADLSESNYGLAIVTKSKYGYSVHDGRMRLSLLRSPKSPDDMCDMGRHSIDFCLLPHWGPFPSAQVISEAAAFSQTPLLTVVPARVAATRNAQVHDLVTLESTRVGSQTGVVIEAIKMAEDVDRGIILRVCECLGGSESVCIRLHPALSVCSAELTDVVEW